MPDETTPTETIETATPETPVETGDNIPDPTVTTTTAIETDDIQGAYDTAFLQS